MTPQSIAVDSQASSQSEPVGRQDANEAQLLGRAGDLAEVGDRRLSSTGDRALAPPVTATDDVPTVTGGREEPVEGEWRARSVMALPARRGTAHHHSST